MRGVWAKMSSFFSRRSADPKNPVKKFTKAHRRALEEYADLKISLEELRRRLAGVVEFDFQNHERRLDSHYGRQFRNPHRAEAHSCRDGETGPWGDIHGSACGLGHDVAAERRLRLGRPGGGRDRRVAERDQYADPEAEG